jgi:hypothetical protein
MVSDGRYAFLTGYQTVWAFEDCVPRGDPNPDGLPRCGVLHDLHLIDVKRALRVDEPKSAAERSAAGG